jgi:protein-S-isoprenylcysteine O-methyltransferase Ste14
VVRVRFEERNSVLVFGQAYRDYQRTTSAFGFGPRRARG